MDIEVKIRRFPNLEIKMPFDARNMKTLAVGVQREIRKQTERGRDINGAQFKPYTPKYRKFRQKKGRSIRPNLLFSGRMLGGMRAIGRKGVAKVILTGQQGLKGWANEERGREFFGLTRGAAESVIRRVSKQVTRMNGLR
jgi:hypothetical protein